VACLRGRCTYRENAGFCVMWQPRRLLRALLPLLFLSVMFSRFAKSPFSPFKNNSDGCAQESVQVVSLGGWIVYTEHNQNKQPD
jgi:hypothetical protein